MSGDADDLAKLHKVSWLRLSADMEMAEGRPRLLNTLAQREMKEFLDGPYFAHYSSEEKIALVHARIKEQQSGSKVSATSTDNIHDKETIQRLQVDLENLKLEKIGVQQNLDDARARIAGRTIDVLIDTDVIKFAGKFDKALRIGEDVFLAAGIAAKNVWSTLRAESYKMFCTDCPEYATTRKIAKASLPLASLELTRTVLEYFDLSVEDAAAISVVVLVVCDAGREKWCAQYSEGVLASPHELDALRGLSQRIPGSDLD
jgi:hypothetical protein